jgi:CIC family chloride channel protein
MAVAAGLLSGLAAIVLRGMIRGVQWLVFDQGANAAALSGLPIPSEVVTIVAPGLGILAAAYLASAWAPEAKGHGVPEVQFAVRMRGGRIRPRVAFAKAVTSAISIGSGGSVGREGPIVQIGSSFGSALGQAAGLGADEIKLLVAAGAAGAVGATFNAPIAGVLFALEVILGNFAARSFGLVVVASVTATAVAQSVLGTQPSFRLVEQFALASGWELTFYPLLGLLAGGLALLYVRSVYGVEDWFDRWSAPRWGKALFGGLLVGLLGTFGSEHLFGVGHEGVELAMAGELTTLLMASLVFMKIFATSVTLGAGGSGGVFAPALFIGAMAGGAFGRVVDAAFPSISASPGAYALVGAAAVFGASTHAPMTAIIILFEMTDNYRIILPLMLSVVIAQLIASRIDPDSIYSIKLRRRGGMLGHPLEPGTLDMLLVADAMSAEVPAVSRDALLSDLADLAREERSRSWVVLDAEQRLVGIVSVSDLERALLEGDLIHNQVRHIMTPAPITCASNETLRRALRRLTERDVYQLPVIDPDEPGRVMGMLRRTDMMWAYKELAAEHQRLIERAGALPESRFHSVHVELRVSPEHRRICDHTIRQLGVPEHALVALLRRGDGVSVPRGFTKVEPGDVLTLITTREHERELQRWVDQVSGGPA